jgi:hypothetical protein
MEPPEYPAFLVLFAAMIRFVAGSGKRDLYNHS